MIGYQLELAARAHQQEMLREAREARLARRVSRDGHSSGRHQLVTAVLVLLLGAALLLV